MVLETVDGQLVTIEINNNAAYGYDVRAELVGELGSVSMNNVSYSRMDMMLSSATRYDADWRGRYHEAYVRQIGISFALLKRVFSLKLHQIVGMATALQKLPKRGCCAVIWDKAIGFND